MSCPNSAEVASLREQAQTAIDDFGTRLQKRRSILERLDTADKRQQLAPLRRIVHVLQVYAAGVLPESPFFDG